MRECTFSEAILEATDQAMASDATVCVMGLGVPDPKGIFGTTVGLQSKYGVDRVMDMPTSENGMTGVAIGLAIAGFRPILTHQRVDFALLSLDQLINNGAKWHYMFGDQMNVPLVVRLIIGRGWGQGPQHSQTLHALFAHIPGLKVVMPSNPYDAKGLLLSSLREKNPVIYFEHRWLHTISGVVPTQPYLVPLGVAKVVFPGNDVTLVTASHMTLEAWKAIQMIRSENISVELIDLRTIQPLDRATIIQSVQKTGRLLVADLDAKSFGLSGEIIALATEEAFASFKCAPQRIAYPDSFSPTSWVLANQFYPTAKNIALALLHMMERPMRAQSLLEEILASRMQPLDVPDASFTGPF